MLLFNSLGTIMYFHKELLLDHPTVHDTGLPSDAEVDAASNGNTNLNTAAEGAWLDANSQLEKEELDVERAISGITEVQVCYFSWLLVGALELKTYLLMVISHCR